jgi:hypothetical protein
MKYDKSKAQKVIKTMKSTGLFVTEELSKYIFIKELVNGSFEVIENTSSIVKPNFQSLYKGKLDACLHWLAKNDNHPDQYEVRFRNGSTKIVKANII